MYFYIGLNFCHYLQQGTNRACSGGVDNVGINEITTDLACLKQKEILLLPLYFQRSLSNRNFGVYSILEHSQCSDDYALVCSFAFTIYCGKGMFI